MTNTQCAMDRVLLEEYADGMLNQVERILVEEHVKSCQHCRKQLTELKLLFWEIGSLAKQRIDYPDMLNELGMRLTANSPAKQSIVRNTLGNLLTSQKKVWSGVFGFVRSVPLLGQARSAEQRSNIRNNTLTERLAGKIKLAGRNMVKKQLAHLFGGAK